MMSGVQAPGRLAQYLRVVTDSLVRAAQSMHVAVGQATTPASAAWVVFCCALSREVPAMAFGEGDERRSTTVVCTFQPLMSFPS